MSQHSSPEASLVDYTEECSVEETQWNDFVLNLNGGIKKNGVIAASLKSQETTPVSPPYIAVPSFEMRWPSNHQGQLNGIYPTAFHLTSHKQLEQAGQDSLEEMLGESDESPPYLPSTKLKPTAPPIEINEKPV